MTEELVTLRKLSYMCSTMKRASASMMALMPESLGLTMGSLASPLALVTSSSVAALGQSQHAATSLLGQS